MELGLFVMPIHPPGRTPADCYDQDLVVLEQADALGFQEAWIGEHLTNVWEPVPAPELVIAAALQRTSRIRLGTGVSCLPNHHPAVLAHRIAQLDHMARGRLLFGIGSGATPTDTAMVGQDPDAGRDLTRAALTTIMEIWRRARSTAPVAQRTIDDGWTTVLPASSEHFRVHLAPYQDPHPPIAVAGLTRASGTLRIAGENGWIPMSINLVSPSILRSHWEATAAGAESAGRPCSRAQWRISRDVHVAATTEQARDETINGPLGQVYREFVLPHLATVGMLGLVTEGHDIDDGDVDVEWLADNLWLVGDPAEVAARIVQLHDDVGGFGVLLQITYDWEPHPEQGARSMELLATEVQPRVEEALAARSIA